MSLEDYWDHDPALVKYYREADRIIRDRANYEKWLQGLYFYEALCDASPVLHSFSGKGVKPLPYPEKPYPLTSKQMENDKRAKERDVAEKGKAILMNMIKRQNDRG